MLVSDGVRPDFLGAYGDSKVNTPTIDWLGKNGICFENVITSAPWTLPSVSSFISGIYSHKLGMFDWQQPLPDNVKTLFHYLKEEDYKVASFVFNEKHLFSNMDFANTQGNCMNINNILPWIEKNKDEKFFLYIHSWWTHIPYEIKDSAEEWREENQRLLKLLQRGEKEDITLCKELYRKSIEKASEELLQGIIKFLKDKNKFEDTMIIFTSDHGETWGERLSDKSEITNNFTLHGRYLYDESIKIPFIIYHPDQSLSNIRVKKQIRTIDILPSLLDVLGIQKHDDKSWRDIDGRSFWNCWEKECNPRIAITSTTDTKSNKIINHQLMRMSIRLPPWKMIWNLSTDELELYNLRKDPEETTNVYNKNEEVGSTLKGLLGKELESVPPGNLPDEKKEKYSIKQSIRSLKGIK